MQEAGTNYRGPAVRKGALGPGPDCVVYVLIFMGFTIPFILLGPEPPIGCPEYTISFSRLTVLHTVWYLYCTSDSYYVGCSGQAA